MMVHMFLMNPCFGFNTQVAKTVALIKQKGGKVTREPGPVEGGSTKIAVVEDPDGYKFELLERAPTAEPLCQVMLRVGDLDRAINFYKKVYKLMILSLQFEPYFCCIFACFS